MKTKKIKTLIFLMLLLILKMPFIAECQPSNWFGDITSVDNSLYADKVMFDRGAFISTEPIMATVTKSNAKFLFNTAPNIYNPKWTGSSTSMVRTSNIKLNGAAYYGQDEYWQEDFNVSIESGKYYIFVSGKNNLSNNDMSIIETPYLPVMLFSVIQAPQSTNIYSTDIVNVTVDASQSLNSGEYIYLRYTTDSWNTSQFAAMTQTGATTYVSTIPSMSAGTTVKYYVLTTINSSPSPNDIDFLTMRLLNNNNLNYEYTVQAVPVYSGISERKIIFNEGTNYTNDFSDTILGTYGNTALLTLKGGQLKTWKTSPDDITGVNMYYRIYNHDSLTLPNFDTIVLPWKADLSIPGEQLWENDTLNELILNNLPDGLYNFEIYYEAFYNDGTGNLIHNDNNNNGNNYKLTFEIDDSISYGTCGVFESYVIVDTTQIVYIEGNIWNNGFIGTFYPINNFDFNGCQVKTFKTGIFDITDVKAYYRHYMQSAIPPLFDTINLLWQQDLTYPGTQLWENDTVNLNIINNLTYGSYYFDIYYELTYKIGILPQTFKKTEDNGGNLYRGSFIFAPVVNIETGMKDLNINIYPVPAHDFINISIKNNSNKTLSIALKDILGNTVIKEQTTADKIFTLETNKLMQGLYFIEISGEGLNFMKKIIIY